LREKFFTVRMRYHYFMKSPRGMTLIDVVVGTALVLIIFLALFGALRASLLLSTLIKNEATANAIAQNQIEYIRSLPYASVGTVGGIPSGTIAQNATTTEDKINYGVRTFIDYYDDPADGTGSNDTNGITTDYKRIKVTVSYQLGSKTWTETLVSDYAPLGMETTLNGGTLQIVVVNASGVAVPGATVTIVNASTSPAVNLTTFSDSNGMVYLPGAATSTQYTVSVTKAGYSTAQTYARTVSNQNPTPGYLTVVQSQTTSGTFAIDALASLTMNSFSPIATSTFSDNFANGSKIASYMNTAAGGGALYLLSGSSSGSAISSTTAPTYLASWGALNATYNTPAGTAVYVHVVDRTGTLIPDSVLPGNAAGFASFPVNLQNISTSTYPALALSASFTSAASSTPSLTNWSLSYSKGPTPLPNVSFTLTGAKTIGTSGAGAPIYKTTMNGNTGSTGSVPESLEWDSYSILVPSYDIEDACGIPPYSLSPGRSVSESLVLGPQTSNSMLVSVTDSSGNPLSGVSVTLSRSGYSSTVTSSSCGNAYFGAISAASDYTVSISKTGYTTTNATGVAASGETLYAISF
jgi:hypothetical protein